MTRYSAHTGAPNGGRLWSVEESRLLRKLAGEGLCPADLAARLGRTEAAVRQRLNLLGIRHVSRRQPQPGRSLIGHPRPLPPSPGVEPREGEISRWDPAPAGD
jgi:hypothetical protein